MPGKKENLRHAEAQPDPDLTFGYNELLEELKQEFDYPVRQPGDITPSELAEVSNLSDRQWYTILNKKVRAGELVKVAVKDKGQNRAYFVYRRAG